jgi:8-oxo-dGTP pyrophosphatase MutT (NUDIX family)
MITNFDEMLTHARAQVSAYLRHFAGEAPLLSKLTRQLFESSEDIFARSNMWGHITTSALVYDPVTDMVLVIYHLGLGRWLQPGGHHEGFDLLYLSALREAIEEAGVDPCVLHAWHERMDGPFDIDTHAIPAQPAKGDGLHLHHDFIYLFVGDSTKPLRPQLSEVREAKWIPRSQFGELPGHRFARLAVKLEAVRH